MKALIFIVPFTLLCLFCARTNGAAGELKCPYPLDEPLFGEIVLNARRRQLTYRCEPGFVLIDMRGRTRFCRRNGRWSNTHGDCIESRRNKKLCPFLESPRNGKVIVSGRNAGDEAHFKCDAGHVLDGSSVRTCQPGQKWDGEQPICQSYKTVEDFANVLEDRFISKLESHTADSTSGAQSKLSVGKSGLDIVLVVDVSSSIGNSSLEHAKKFMKMIIGRFGVSQEKGGGKNGTRVALITFDTTFNIVFNLNDKNVRSKEAVFEKIDALTVTGGGTNFHSVLMAINVHVYMRVINRDARRRKDATRAIFFITDSEMTVKSNDADVKSIANVLRNTRGFEIFAIGVGKRIDKTVLGEIASPPFNEHVFLISKFEDIGRMTDIISERNIDYGMCGVSGNTDIQQGTQNAKHGAWPWLGWISVVSKTATKTCGGALVCNRWFITAASCVSRIRKNRVTSVRLDQVNVHLGEMKLYDKDDSEVIVNVKDIRIHDDYTDDVNEYGVRDFDVALLDFGDNEDKWPALNKYIKPICVGTNDTDDEDNLIYRLSQALLQMRKQTTVDSQIGYTAGFTAGWGHSPENLNDWFLPWQRLKQNKRRVRSDNKCSKRYPNLDTDMFFCVGNTFRRSKTCRGDIGGPYMDEMSNRRYSILGLNLKSRDCTEKYKFSIFLNLLHPDIAEWLGRILSGCNRWEEIVPDIVPDKRD